MKVQIVIWCGEGYDQIKQAGYENQMLLEDVDPFEVAKKLYEQGLNVLIYRAPPPWKSRRQLRADQQAGIKPEERIVVGVDTQRFQSR